MISGRGSNMIALLDAMETGLPAEPVLVISNEPDAAGLETATQRGIPIAVVNHRDFGTREAFDAALTKTIRKSEPDIICMAGFMRRLSEGFINDWAGRMINIHPSLLPSFKGLNTHKRALEAGACVHGCSVHEVTLDLDSGRILGQAVVPVQEGDTEETLAKRVLVQEHRLYPLVLEGVLAGKTGPISLLAE
jgi:phosphoribosylglycinamide formyltransferase-1